MTKRYIALLPVRDEGDIISQCLSHALSWADRIYVYDTGSVDETYDIVQTMAQQDDRIRIVAKEPVYYNENRVRGLLFEVARKDLRDGDWFVRLDADEFHHISPRDFVASRLSPNEGVVYHQYFDFQLTLSEAQALQTEEEIDLERQTDIALRRRAYTVSFYAEPRMCKYRASMRWPVSVSFPFNCGLVAKQRIPIRHYPHRDPRQLNRRCKLRAVMMSDRQNRSNWSDPEAHHWVESDWRAFLVEDDAAELQLWEPGSDLPDVNQFNHLASPQKRLLQRAIYAIGLPRFMDLFREAWTSEAHPLAISSETQRILEKELG